MPKVLISLSLPLLATLLLPACVSAPISLQTQRTGCDALIPPSWRERVQAPEFHGNGDLVGDWQAYADAVAGRLGVANDQKEGTIYIFTTCEARDAAAVHQATRRRFLGLF